MAIFWNCIMLFCAIETETTLTVYVTMKGKMDMHTKYFLFKG